MKKIGISLSGGGMTGLAHIGVIKALLENKIVPEIITGTSMGAIIAALYSYGIEIEEITKIIYSINKGILDFDIKNILLSLLNKKLPDGIIKGNKIENLISKYTNKINIKDIQKNRLAIVSANANGGENVIFSNVQLPPKSNRIYINDIELSRAARASMGFPFIFAPIKIDDMILVDGGVVNNSPANICQELGAEFIIISSMEYHGEKLKDPKNGVEIFSQSLYIALKEASLNDYDAINVPTLKIKFNTLKELPLLDISKENIDYAINTGYQDTIKFLSTMDLNFMK